VFRKLELDESRALCMYEKVKRLVELFSAKLPKFENIDQKREAALELVAAIKSCLVKHWGHLNEEQRATVS
jgi:hypothetical protein